MYSNLCLCASSSCVCSWSFGLQSHKCVKNRNWVAPPSCHISGIFTTEINLSFFKKQTVREWLLLRFPAYIKMVFVLKGDDGTWYRTQAVSSRLCSNVVNFLFFMFCWLCFLHIIMIRRYAEVILNIPLFSTTRTNCCIFTVYPLMMGYKNARNM